MGGLVSGVARPRRGGRLEGEWEGEVLFSQVGGWGMYLCLHTCRGGVVQASLWGVELTG